MLNSDRPIAFAISFVSSVPAAPTSVPPISSKVLPRMYPPAATDRPVKALSSEITIGTSAPPTGSTNSTPTVRPTSARMTPSHIRGSTTRTTERATTPINAPPKSTGRPGNRTGREVISPCSFANVTIDPEKLTAPMTTVNAVATKVKVGTAARSTSTIPSSSSSATRAAAAPPTPLKRATS